MSRFDLFFILVDDCNEVSIDKTTKFVLLLSFSQFDIVGIPTTTIKLI